MTRSKVPLFIPGGDLLQILERNYKERSPLFCLFFKQFLFPFCSFFFLTVFITRWDTDEGCGWWSDYPGAKWWLHEVLSGSLLTFHHFSFLFIFCWSMFNDLETFINFWSHLDLVSLLVLAVLFAFISCRTIIINLFV